MWNPIGTFVALAAPLLAGCATTLHSIPADYAPESKPEAVVIGHVVLDMGAKPIEFFDKLYSICVMVTNGSTGEEYEIVCDEKGSDSDFYVALPSGEYSLSKISKGNQSSSLTGHFTVPAAPVVYVGALKFSDVAFASSVAFSLLSGKSGIVGKWHVVDDYPKAMPAFRSRFAQITAPDVKSLVVLD